MNLTTTATGTLYRLVFASLRTASSEVRKHMCNNLRPRQGITFARAQKLRTVFSPRQYFQFPYPSFPTSTALKHKFRNVPSHAKIVEKANS